MLTAPELRDAGAVTGEGGVRVPFAVAGPPTGRRLVFTHSLLASGLDAGPFLNPLVEAGWEVATLDQRGHGRADRVVDPARFGLDEMGGDLVRILDALQWDRAWLVGASLGTATALSATFQAPHRVDGLVLMAPAFDAEPNAARASFVEVADAFHREGVDAGIAAWAARFAGGGPVPEFHETSLRAMGATSAGHLLREVMGWTLDLGRIAALDVPVGVIAWEGDDVHPLSVAERIVATARTGALEVVGAVDPMALFERAAAMLQRLEEDR